MKTLLLTSLLACGFFTLHCQHVLWGKTLTKSPLVHSNYLAADEEGYFYNYGIRHSLQGQAESYIEKYDPSGKVVFTTIFTGSVVPTGLVAAGDKIYCSGWFSGNVTFDQTAASSLGSSDGFIASLQGSGRVSWVSVIDGQGKDEATGIAFNAVSGKLMVTGGVNRSFSYNGALKEAVAQPAMLLAEINTDGTLFRHKLHDFHTSDTLGNKGLEIHTDQAGNSYVLHYREGKNWSQTHLSGPEDGIYLGRLDQNLDFLWANFIINSGCYYGFSCRRMTAIGSGDCFVPSFCEYKYGGSGIISGFSPQGTLSYTLGNPDGAYSDLCARGGNVYAVGTESANGCPCEDNFRGYEVIRKIGDATPLFSALRDDVMLTNITVSSTGLILVNGFFYSPTLDLGTITLLNETNGGAMPFMMALGEASHISGMEESAENLFSVYPNPSQGEIHIRLAKSATASVSMKVMDISGRIIHQSQHHSVSQSRSLNINLAAEQKGLYFVEVLCGDSREVCPVVID